MKGITSEVCGQNNLHHGDETKILKVNLDISPRKIMIKSVEIEAVLEYIYLE